MSSVSQTEFYTMNLDADVKKACARTYTVATVKTAVDILKFLTRMGHRRSSLAEISKALSVSKSSCFSVLKTLQDTDFVSYDEVSKKYSLGLALLELGGVVADEMDDVAVARSFVRDLVDQTQETCIIVRWINGQLVVLHCEEPVRDVRVTVAVGLHLRWNTGAFGKAYLSFASVDDVRQVVASTTPGNVTSHGCSIDEFLKDLAKCRENGYAESHEEAVPGVNAVAAPVFNKNGSVVFVIGILGFSSSLSREMMRRDGFLIGEAARRISAALGSPNRYYSIGEIIAWDRGLL